MSKKKSYEEIYEFFKSKGLELLDREYVGNSTKVSCVDSDGYKVQISYSDLSSGKIPSRVHKSNPYTIDNMKYYIKLNNNNIELISTQYLGTNEKLIFKCIIHNDEFEISWTSFQQNHGCPICGGSQKLTIPIIKQRIVDLDRDKEVKLLSVKYINTRSKLIFECLIHNKEFPMSWMSFCVGNGCPICGIEIRSGDKSCNWKGGITPLHNHLRGIIRFWKIDSFNKYDKKCDITGLKLKDNVIHHLHPFSEILKETMRTLNLPIYQEINKYSELELKNIEDKCLELHYNYGLGVCLTEKLHKELHSYYGGSNVRIDKQQYLEFRCGYEKAMVDLRNELNDKLEQLNTNK